MHAEHGVLTGIGGGNGFGICQHSFIAVLSPGRGIYDDGMGQASIAQGLDGGFMRINPG